MPLETFSYRDLKLFHIVPNCCLMLLCVIRWLVSLYNLACQQYSRQAQKADGLSWPRMWVLCDGNDKNHTACISALIHSAQTSSTSKKHDITNHRDVGIVGDERLIVSGYVITSTGSTVYFCETGRYVWLGICYCFLLPVLCLSLENLLKTLSWILMQFVKCVN